MKRRVAVTGLGIVCPIGNTKEEVWDSVTNARGGIAPITRYDTEGRKVTLAGEVKNLDFEIEYSGNDEMGKLAGLLSDKQKTRPFGLVWCGCS